MVDRSADLAGDAFLLVGAADRGEGRRPLEHDQIEIGGAEPVAVKQRVVSPEVIFNHVEKPVGARFGTVLDDVGGRGVAGRPDDPDNAIRYRQGSS
jgi:hypothetical protein